MIKLCHGYNNTSGMGELQWGGHVGWLEALRCYICDWIKGHKPNLVVCYAEWKKDWFILYHRQ